MRPSASFNAAREEQEAALRRNVLMAQLAYHKNMVRLIEAELADGLAPSAGAVAAHPAPMASPLPAAPADPYRASGYDPLAALEATATAAPSHARASPYESKYSSSPVAASSSAPSRYAPSPSPVSLRSAAVTAVEIDHGVRRLEGKVAVVVTDMSGFTRITRKMGIVHFASLILKMREILRGIFEHYGASIIEVWSV